MIRIADLCDETIDAADVGIHLCYNDPGHKHIVESKSLGTSVAFANDIAAATTRIIDFVHMAVQLIGPTQLILDH